MSISYRGDVMRVHYIAAHTAADTIGDRWYNGWHRYGLGGWWYLCCWCCCCYIRSRYQWYACRVLPHDVPATVHMVLLSMLLPTHCTRYYTRYYTGAIHSAVLRTVDGSAYLCLLPLTPRLWSLYYLLH